MKIKIDNAKVVYSKIVSTIGNGGHVLIPKKHIGENAIVVIEKKKDK